MGGLDFSLGYVGSRESLEKVLGKYEKGLGITSRERKGKKVLGRFVPLELESTWINERVENVVTELTKRNASKMEEFAKKPGLIAEKFKHIDECSTKVLSLKKKVSGSSAKKLGEMYKKLDEQRIALRKEMGFTVKSYLGRTGSSFEGEFGTLEGGEQRLVLEEQDGYLADFLAAKDTGLTRQEKQAFQGIQKEVQNARKLANLINDSGSTRTDCRREINKQISELQPGEAAWIPGGYLAKTGPKTAEGHAVMYLVERQTDGNYSFTLVNTGEGLEDTSFHPKELGELVGDFQDMTRDVQRGARDLKKRGRSFFNRIVGRADSVSSEAASPANEGMIKAAKQLHYKKVDISKEQIVDQQFWDGLVAQKKPRKGNSIAAVYSQVDKHLGKCPDAPKEERGRTRAHNTGICTWKSVSATTKQRLRAQGLTGQTHRKFKLYVQARQTAKLKGLSTHLKTAEKALRLDTHTFVSTAGTASKTARRKIEVVDAAMVDKLLRQGEIVQSQREQVKPLDPARVSQITTPSPAAPVRDIGPPRDTKGLEASRETKTVPKQTKTPTKPLKKLGLGARLARFFGGIGSGIANSWREFWSQFGFYAKKEE